MKYIIPVTLALLFCGCVSNKKAETKPSLQRPWVGGHFENVKTPAPLRTESSTFGKESALVTRLYNDTPLQKAGLEEGDLILAINGIKVRYAHEIAYIIEQSGGSSAEFTIYRKGELLSKTIMPGVETYQKDNLITFGIGLSSRLELDLLPDPSFSLVALGFKKDRDQLDLRDAKSQYVRGLAADNSEHQSASSLRSNEGWKFWLGPLSLEQRHRIISQE